jgi:ferredoxin
VPKVRFIPVGQEFDVEPSTKLLAVAIRNKVKIRFGCASCRCGTCGVAVAGGTLSPMRPDEKALLAKMALPTDGTVRLACQTRIVSGTVTVDLDFQDTYSPDQGEDD